ncbi:MAG TPA: biosynthetic peptidoglycan transglycosylase [Flavobacterium lutivivi]|nr:biosynthetic peptidoglycan transglycosylase [Flavobacterium lutivivi]
MAKTINKIGGKLILALALIRLKYSTCFKNKYIQIKNNIINTKNKDLILSNYLIKSIISIEDKRFFHHIGIDLYSIFRAIVKNITSNRLEGASTITQQLVRNITNNRELNFKRKISEIMLAVLVEKEFTKNEILNAYLNLYQFNFCVGISDFCKIERYNLNKLSNHECYEIAARFKYPKVNHINYIKFLKRVRTIERNNT